MDTPILPPAFECGICNITHPCHCPRMRHGCAVCVAPIAEQEHRPLSEVGLRNLIARAVAIPLTWCWTCARENCGQDHKSERPAVPLVGRMGA